MAISTNFDEYLIVRPENGGLFDLFKYLVLGDISSGVRFLGSSEEAKLVGEETADHRWVIVVSIIVRKIVAYFSKPLEHTGYVVDFVLNLLSQNGNMSDLLYNLFQGNVVIPQRGTDTFLNTIGQLDGRIDLYRGLSILEQVSDSDFGGNKHKNRIGKPSFHGPVYHGIEISL